MFNISYGLFAQNNHSVGARQMGIGGSGVVLSDTWSSFHNQAGLADIHGLSVGVFISNKFGIKELGLKSFTVAKPVQRYGSFALSYSYFGFELFNENKFGFAYSLKLAKRLSAGIQIDYLLTSQALDYGNNGAVAGEIGILSEPIDNLYIGAHLFNPWRADYSDYSNTKIPTILRVGMAYNFSKKMIFTIEGQKDLEYKPIFRAGIEYNVFKNFIIRTGISTQPIEYSFGIGYKYKIIIIDIAFINHQVLGYYLQFGLSFVIKNKNNNKYTYENAIGL